MPSALPAVEATTIGALPANPDFAFSSRDSGFFGIVPSLIRQRRGKPSKNVGKGKPRFTKAVFYVVQPVSSREFSGREVWGTLTCTQMSPSRNWNENSRPRELNQKGVPGRPSPHSRRLPGNSARSKPPLRRLPEAMLPLPHVAKQLELACERAMQALCQPAAAAPNRRFYWGF